jgi:hypothetical protein
MTMKNATIYPGSMEVIGQALDKFGEKRVVTGAWDEPVKINNLTEEETAIVRKLFGDLGCKVIEEQEIAVTDGTPVNVHG